MLNTKRVILCLLGILSTHAMAINKCTSADGKVSFQDAPCAAGTSAARIVVKPAAGPAGSQPAQAKASAPERANPASPTQTEQPVQNQPPQKSELERLADACLEWYKPMLRDPRGAYHRDAQLGSSVLQMTIYATNGFGGYTSKSAACEIKRGQVDDGWTRIHAGRGGWIQK